MHTLEQLINIELKDLVENFNLDKKFEHIEYFIQDDTSSSNFIRSILNDETFQHPDEGSTLYNVAKARSRHSALTFLIGMVFKKFGNLYESFENTTLHYGKKTNLKLWMMTSLAHDKGYYSERLRKNIPAHKQKFTYELLSDDYHGTLIELQNYSHLSKNVLAYKYSDIEAYDDAAVDYHKKRNDEERVDHGILGGYIVFNNYIRQLTKGQTTINNKELFSIKTCALTITQHNMFKSDRPEDDESFPNKPLILQSTSQFRVSTSTPLLLFLSFIDTFECVKKFSKDNNPSNIKTMTLLRKIKVKVTEGTIEIDFSDFIKHVNSKKDKTLNDSLKGYLKNIKMLSNWTVLHAQFNTENVCKITIN